ncbi:MAG: hypothetical protein AAF429_09130 [Pseudomonadota bacterium]
MDNRPNISSDINFWAVLITNLKAQTNECFAAFRSSSGQVQERILRNFGPGSKKPYLMVWQTFATPQLIYLVAKVEDETGLSFYDWYDETERPPIIAEMMKKDLASIAAAKSDEQPEIKAG